MSRDDFENFDATVDPATADRANVDPAAVDPAAVDPAIEALGFGGLDTDDLLRFVESEMAEHESDAFLASVRAGDEDAADRLVRMRRDHEVMRSTMLPVVGPDLLAPLRARVARGELIGDRLLGEEGIEPTDMMSKSVEELARRRRWNRRRPLVQVAAGIAIAAAAGVVVVQVVDQIEWTGIDPMAWISTGLEPADPRAPEPPTSPGLEPSATVVAADEGIPGIGRPALDGAPAEKRATIEEVVGTDLASFGVAFAWDAADETFETRLASLALELDAVLVRNLTLIESVGASGRGLAAGLARAAGTPSSVRGRPRDLQPSPIVGMIDDAPETRVRIDLAERGFRYALVVPRGQVAEVIARMSTLGAGGDGAATRLVPAGTDRPDVAFEADAWSSWARHAEAMPTTSKTAESLVVPIAVIDAARRGD